MLAGAGAERSGGGGCRYIRWRNESANDQSDYLAGNQVGKLAEKRLKSHWLGSWSVRYSPKTTESLQRVPSIPCKYENQVLPSFYCVLADPVDPQFDIYTAWSELILNIELFYGFHLARHSPDLIRSSNLFVNYCLTSPVRLPRQLQLAQTRVIKLLNSN